MSETDQKIFGLKVQPDTNIDCRKLEESSHSTVGSRFFFASPDMFSGLTLVTGSQLIVEAHYFERRSVLSTDNLLAWDYGTMHTW